MIALVLEYLRPGADRTVISDFDNSGKRFHTIQWRDPRPQPTAQEIADAQESPEFAAWLVEHGGDPEATALREAREKLDTKDTDVRLLLAITRVLVEELNTLRTQHSLPLLTAADIKARVKDLLK